VNTHLPAVPRDPQRATWLKVASSQGSAEPSPAGSAASLTYEPYYGLKEKPFSLSADPRFLFRSPSHAPAFDRLLAGIRRREGLIVLSGEIGTGKTTLCRAVLGDLDRRTFSAFVPDPFVSREDLLKMLLVDFGVMSVEDLKCGRLRDASRSELSYPLYEFLNSLVPLQAFAVLVIDEAQNLPLPLLEEIRILSDLEGREKLLQVVLVGQPELRSNLKLPQMRQVDQRVSVRCELAPMRRREVTGYVTWRLNVASGGACDRVTFTSEALDAVYRASGGTPRIINLICDRALYQGHLHRVNTIDAVTVVSALEDLGLPDALPESIAAVATASMPEPAVEAHAASASGAVAEFASEAPAPQTARRSVPRLALALLVLLVLLGGALGAGAWYVSRTNGIPAEVSRRPALSPPVAAARTPGTAAAPEAVTAAQSKLRADGHAYVIQVATLESPRRAARLVDQLAKAGYRAHHTELTLDGGRVLQVLVGGYKTLADAQSDLDRIRQIPSYGDAALKSVGSRAVAWPRPGEPPGDGRAAPSPPRADVQGSAREPVNCSERFYAGAARCENEWIPRR
jgi:general secretion pathway protein A